MVPDAPDLSVFLNGSNVAVGLGYGSYTLYSSIVPGNISMQVQSYSHAITADTSFAVAVNRYYSVFLTDTTAAIKPIVLRDSFPQPDTGYCGLRFLIFSPGISGIDFHILKSDSTINQTGWANRSYGDNITLDSINTFKKYKSGTYSFFITSRTNVKDTLTRFTSKTFGDSSNYTLLLEGHFATGDTALQLGIRLH